MNSPAHEYPISTRIRAARAVAADPEAYPADEVETAIMILDWQGAAEDRASIVGKTDSDLIAGILAMRELGGERLTAHDRFLMSRSVRPDMAQLDDDQESDGVGLARFVVIGAMMSAAGLLYVAIGGAF